jgi:hypothetical protein
VGAFHISLWCSLWLPHDLQVFHERLKALEAHVDKDGIVLKKNRVMGPATQKERREAFAENRLGMQ